MSPGSGYTLFMDTGIICNQSAFKHGLTRADIEWAFLHPIRNGLLEDYANKYLLIGFDTRGVLLKLCITELTMSG
jgi:hypothetical protein